MKVAIIYESKTGNTKLIADSIKAATEKDHNVIFKSAKEALETSNDIIADLYFLGSWTDKGDCGAFIKKFSKTLNNKRVALFGTAGFSGSQTYYNNLAKRFSKELDSSNSIIGSFYSQGKMPLSIKRRYLTLLKQNPSDKNIKVSIMNFDEAKSHPDSKDLKDAQTFALDILNKTE